MNKLEAALQLAKDMIIANGLNIPHTMEIIDEALEEAKIDRGHSDLLQIHEITQSIAEVKPIDLKDSMTVRWVKQMAMLINKLTR